MRTTWNFWTAGQLVFGPGASGQLGELLGRQKLNKVFVVTDPNLEQAGIVDQVRQPLQLAGINVHVFDGGVAEPSLHIAQQSIDAACRFQPDAILGLGGGSNIDLAKITATVYSHGGVPSDYFGFDNVPGPVLPLICVPTTSGTGSEVSQAAVLTDTDNEMKVSTLSNYQRPTIAVVDPLLTISCPPQVTADSGIDALTHAIEAYTAVDFDKMETPPGEACAYEGRYPLCDCFAEKAIDLVRQHLVTGVREPDNVEARCGMSLAATMAGVAFSNGGVALVHALEYPIGAALHCSHGAGNGLLLPYVMRFNLPVRKRTFARIAQLLGEDLSGLSEDQSAESAISAIMRLRSDIGIPDRIRDLGGTEDQLARFAEKAFAVKRLHWVNPRQPTLEDLQQILKSAY